MALLWMCSILYNRLTSFMNKKIISFFCAIALFGGALFASNDGSAFSERVIRDNFSVDVSRTDLSFLDSPILYETVALPKADFSQIPNYSFSYLNNLIVNAINASVKSFDGVVYSINMKDIPDALIAARDRGVKVRLIIDHSHIYPRMDTQIKKLLNAGNGIELRASRGYRTYGVNHNKITIHDGELVTVGSYNWTFGATFSNYENTIVARHPVYVEGYKKYFEWMWSHSVKIEQGPIAEQPVGAYGLPPIDPKPVMSLNGTVVPAYLFSPGSDTENKIAQLMDSAKFSIDAVTFTFSSKPIADAIIRAHKRGVKVRFLEDVGMAKKSSMARYVFENGVPMRWMGGRNEKGAMHNKFIVFDGKILTTGSYNFTTNGSINSFENLIFVSDENAIKSYQSKFDWFYSQAAAPTSVEEFDVEPIQQDNTSAGE